MDGVGIKEEQKEEGIEMVGEDIITRTSCLTPHLLTELAKDLKSFTWMYGGRKFESRA